MLLLDRQRCAHDAPHNPARATTWAPGCCSRGCRTTRDLEKPSCYGTACRTVDLHSRVQIALPQASRAPLLGSRRQLYDSLSISSRAPTLSPALTPRRNVGATLSLERLSRKSRPVRVSRATWWLCLAVLVRSVADGVLVGRAVVWVRLCWCSGRQRPAATTPQPYAAWSIPGLVHTWFRGCGRAVWPGAGVRLSQAGGSS